MLSVSFFYKTPYWALHFNKIPLWLAVRPFSLESFVCFEKVTSWGGEEFFSIVKRSLPPLIWALIATLVLRAATSLSQDMFAPESPRRANISNSYCRQPSTRIHLIWQATYTRGDPALEAILRRYHARDIVHQDAPDTSIPITTVETAVIGSLRCRADGGVCTRISVLLEGDFLGSAWCGIDGPPPVSRVLPRTLRVQGASITP